MSAQLSYDLKDGAQYIMVDDRWNVLTVLVLHSNIRNRCYPSMETVARMATNGNLNRATRAKKWLIAAGAIQIVPHGKRVGDEKELPPRQHVYQLTGVFFVEINGERKRFSYLYFNDITPEIINGDNFKIMPVEIINGDKGSVPNISISANAEDAREKPDNGRLPMKSVFPVAAALSDAFGMPINGRTKGDRGRFMKAAREMVEIGCTPDEAREAYHYVKNMATAKKWTDWSVNAVSQRFAEFRTARQKQPQRVAFTQEELDEMSRKMNREKFGIDQ